MMKREGILSKVLKQLKSYSMIFYFKRLITGKHRVD